MMYCKRFIGAFFSVSQGRYAWIDALRGVVFLNMLVYHVVLFSAQYNLFNNPLVGTVVWSVYQKLIAGSFFFLVGVSLYLSRSRGLKLKKVLIRTVQLLGAALIVTITSVFLYPNAVIIFGILHAIALFYLLGLFYLRYQCLYPLSFFLGLSIIIIAQFYQHDLFNGVGFIWTGLGTKIPAAFDYQPFFPWFGVVLIGMSMGKIIEKYSKRTVVKPNRWILSLTIIGQHTLFLYLVHAPVILVVLMVMKKFITR